MARKTLKDKRNEILSQVPVGSDVRLGSGVSLVDIGRMKRVLKRSPSVAKRAFSPEEQRFCQKQTLPEVAFAQRFAARLAVIKALSLTMQDGLGLHSVEVVCNAKGRPRLVLSGKLAERAECLGVHEMPLSLSFTHTEAVACVIALTKTAQQMQEKSRDIKEELASQFKEARALLEALDESQFTTEKGDYEALRSS